MTSNFILKVFKYYNETLRLEIINLQSFHHANYADQLISSLNDHDYADYPRILLNVYCI